MSPAEKPCVRLRRLVLLQTPEDADRSLNQPGNILSERNDGLGFTEHAVDARIHDAQLNAFGKLLRLARSEVPTNSSLSASSFGSSVQPNHPFRPLPVSGAKKSGLNVSAWIPEGDEAVPAALRYGGALRTARDQSGPVHRLKIDLEACAAQQFSHHRRIFIQARHIGRQHQDNGRAVIAGFLQKLLSTLELEACR